MGFGDNIETCVSVQRSSMNELKLAVYGYILCANVRVPLNLSKRNIS